MDYVSLIGAYRFNGIEPHAQIPKYVILKKVLNNNAWESLKKKIFFFFFENVSLIFSLKRKVWEEHNFRKIMFWKEEVKNKKNK